MKLKTTWNLEESEILTAKAIKHMRRRAGGRASLSVSVCVTLANLVQIKNVEEKWRSNSWGYKTYV